MSMSTTLADSMRSRMKAPQHQVPEANEGGNAHTSSQSDLTSQTPQFVEGGGMDTILATGQTLGLQVIEKYGAGKPLVAVGLLAGVVGMFVSVLEDKKNDNNGS